MKNIIYVLLFVAVGSTAQNKYLTKTGLVSFEASVPSFEEVSAKNNSVTAIINSDNGEFAAQVLIKGFRFKNALMEEHFNENYAESEFYPKATFKGKIRDFSLSRLSTDQSTLKIDGELEFHGKIKKFEDLEFSISLNNDQITISGDFIANASDYDIKIPKIVRSKIAEDVTVSFEFELKKQ